jgi:hypothetical protein
VWRVLVYVLSIQNSQKGRHLYENEHDERHKYIEMLNKDNDNQDEMSYTLRPHMERNGNPICERDMDAKRGNKDTQTEIYFGEQE